MITLGFVTGCEPGKWIDRYAENTPHGINAQGMDDPMAALLTHEVDVALVRLPDPRLDTDEMHLVRLYEESRGVAVPKDSVFAEAGGAMTPADVEGEIVNYRLADDGTVDVVKVRDALQIVAANVGIAIAPAPLLKILSKKQVVPLIYDDETVPVTSIALAWFKDRDADDIQDFVGVAKGRGANSTRQSAPAAKHAKHAAKKSSGKKPAARKPASRKPRRTGKRR